MLIAQQLPTRRECSTEHILGLVVFALLLVEQTELVHHGDSVRMCSQISLRVPKRLVEQPFGFVKIPRKITVSELVLPTGQAQPPSLIPIDDNTLRYIDFGRIQIIEDGIPLEVRVTR